LADRVGTIEKGKRADIILVNLDNITEPYLDAGTSILDALIYRGRALDVDTTIVDGQVLMKGRRLTTVNRADIVGEIREQLTQTLKPHEVERKEAAKQLVLYVHRYFQGWSLDDVKPHSLYNAV
jgi:5-methylthioadenosine/S-adenosylhomocysteine deaminase